MNDLSKEYDLIVIGTGFTECLLAAAAARVGKKVLHLDKNEYYGGPWASFSLQALQDWLQDYTTKPKDVPEINTTNVLLDGESIIATSDSIRSFLNVSHQWNIPDEIPTTTCPTDIPPLELINKEENYMDEKEEDESTTIGCHPEKSSEHSVDVSKSLDTSKSEDCGPKQWSRKELLAQSRKFNLDLTVKLLYSRGSMVELLISSNVARYMEFKCTTRLLTWMKGGLVQVPCSRSDVFTTSTVSLIEKRLLMKFLELCHKYEQSNEVWKEYENGPFIDFLKSQKLTPTLIHFVTSAIAMVSPDTPCLNGLKRTQLFLTSLGRYGASPFLFSMYGCGEMPQAFCRLCAVFEGTYILRRGVEAIILNSNDNNVSGLISEGDHLKCSHLVMQSSCAPQEYTCQSKQSVSRAIYITNKSILSHESDQLTLLRFPKGDNIMNPITVLEVNSSTGVCPKDLFVVHMVCEGDNAEQDFLTAESRLFSSTESDNVEENLPKVLWSMHFNQVNYIPSANQNIPSNIHFCSGPDAKLDYDDAIAQARDLFLKIYPDEEFLPRAPDPEEIVFDNEGSQPIKDDNFETRLSDQDKSEDGPEQTYCDDSANNLRGDVRDKNFDEPLVDCSQST